MKVRSELVTLVWASLVALTAFADSTSDTEAFQQAYAAYQELSGQRNFRESLPYAQAVYELGEKLFPEESENLAVLNYNYGLNLLDLKMLDEAMPVLEKALQRYENLYGKDSERLIPLLMDLGAASAEFGDARPQTRIYSRALGLAKTHYGKDSVAYGKLMLQAGRAITQQTQTVYGGRYLKDAHRIFSKELGPDASLTGVAAFFLGKYEMQRRRYEAAVDYLQAALTTFESPDRPSNQIELTTHAFLVGAYEELGDSSKATAHCQAIGRMTAERGDQEFVPLYRKAPEYPYIAQKRGLSGYVLVRFTVDDQGFVEDVETLEVSGHSSFEEPAVEAVKKFRYAPSFSDGKPVVTSGVLTRLSFNLED